MSPSPVVPAALSLPVQLHVRPGSSAEVRSIVPALGRRAVVFTGTSQARSAFLIPALTPTGVALAFHAIVREPTIDDVTRAVEVLRAHNADVVIAIGGGSVLDAAKAAAALATNPGHVFDYLEVVGRGQPLTAASLPVVALPTTAGTGSEVTRNAVLASPEHRVKVSLRHDSMHPRAAIVDATLTLDLPPAVTASTGLDALTQLIEAFVSSRANPTVDALAIEGIRRAAVALPRAYRDGHDLEARAEMAVASLWSGMALSNAGLGAVHGLAGPIGGMFPAPHGGVCAALLSHVMAANLTALRLAGRTAEAAKFDAVAQALTGEGTARAEAGIEHVRRLVAELAVPPLSRYGLSTTDLPDIAAAAQRASSMKANPIALSPEVLEAIVAQAL